MLFYWFLKYVAIGPIVKLVFRPQVEGAENVPRSGAAVLASNHLAASDWVFMPLVLRRRVTFLAKAEYFTGTGVKGALQRAFFAGSGQVPIDRSGGRAARAALEVGLKILREGGIFGIYPEGTRSPDGRLLRNGEPLNEPYLGRPVTADEPAAAGTWSFEVPDGRMVVLGDHRAASRDSRALLGAPGGGLIPLERVEGRAAEIVWPLARRGTVDAPSGDTP